MELLAHRGFWRTPAEKNSERAFRRAFDAGYGIETDLRDRLGELVISHDPATGGEMTLAEFLALPADPGLPLALNIKADGLAVRVRDALAGSGRTNWFVFDMSVPDTRQQLKAGNPVYLRVSEHEPQPPFQEAARGIWLDAFDGRWFGADEVRRWLARGLKVCVVSCELHGRDPAALWQALAPLAGMPGLALCTDRPDEARARFHLPTEAFA
jgi:hypothetical protein